MDVPGTVKANNDITPMNEAGPADVSGAPTSSSIQQNVVETVNAVSSGQKSDGRHQPYSKKKSLIFNGTDDKLPSNFGPGPKSPEKKVPDVSDLPTNISKSRTIRFHKLFKDVPVVEYPIESFSCAFKGDILLQGQMYLTHNWVCFYSKIKARGRRIEIPFDKIISITREKLALIIPNAIGIQTADQKYVFGSFMSRDSTYKKLVSVWKVNQDLILGNIGLDLRSSVLGHSNSADSSESDTTEDDLNANEQLGRVLSTSSAHNKMDVEAILHPEPSAGVRQAGNQCLNCKSAVKTFCSLSFKLQKIPRTNMLLAICTILVFFLLLSAIGLTYKILLLQSRLEMRTVWTPQASVSFRDRAMGNLYWLQTESHASVVRQLHSMLEANIHLLEEVHVLLRSLYRDPSSNSSNTSKEGK